MLDYMFFLSSSFFVWGGVFATKVHYLVQQGAYHIQGYTAYTLQQTLSNTVCWRVVKVVRSLRREDLDSGKAACLVRMQAWHRLAIITLRAEFPDFEIRNAFAIFCLARQRGWWQDPFHT